MTKIEEVDMMVCAPAATRSVLPRVPLPNCGTFLCIMCSNRGIVLCKECQTKKAPHRHTWREVG